MAELRWHYGIESQGQPSERMFHHGCGGQIWYLKNGNGDGLICDACGQQQDGESQETLQPEAEPKLSHPLIAEANCLSLDPPELWTGTFNDGRYFVFRYSQGMMGLQVLPHRDPGQILVTSMDVQVRYTTDDDGTFRTDEERSTGFGVIWDVYLFWLSLVSK